MARKKEGLIIPHFLDSCFKVGIEWNDTFSEAKSRLDKTEPIFWLISLNKNDKKDFVRIGESSYFSGMYVGDEGILQLSNPKLETTELKH